MNKGVCLFTYCLPKSTCTSEVVGKVDRDTFQKKSGHKVGDHCSQLDFNNCEVFKALWEEREDNI